MAQTAALVATLKACLKAHGITYAQVAVELGLSEASVKRLFSAHSFSVDRLDKVCQLMAMEISDLVQQMNERQQRIQRLSEAQEQQIAEDLVLLLVTVCVLNRWTLNDIMNTYQLSEPDCIRKLVQLDKLHIIELLPANRIKLLIAPNFAWRERGPIQRFFRERIGQEYFRTSFKGDDEHLLVLNGMLSKSSNGEFQRRMQRLAQEFNELNNEDAALPITDRHGVTLVLAMRNWNYGLFQPLLRRSVE